MSTHKTLGTPEVVYIRSLNLLDGLVSVTEYVMVCLDAGYHVPSINVTDARITLVSSDIDNQIQSEKSGRWIASD